MTQRTIVILSFILFACGLLWGAYTFLVYLGVPIHQLVYMTQDQAAQYGTWCGQAANSSTYLCKGTAIFLPFLTSFLLMGSPFLSYVIVSLLIFAGFLGWAGFKTGHFSVQLKLRPVYFIGFFALAVWLLATTFSLGSVYNENTPDSQRVLSTTGDKILPPFTRFYEPTADTYAGSSAQALTALQGNYQDLLARGCLGPITNAQGEELATQSGAKVYDLSFLCMQESIFARAGLQFLLVLFLLIDLLVLGRFLLSVAVRLRPVHPLLQLCLSFGVGALAMSAILWTVAVFGVLNAPVVRVIFFGLPLLLYPWTLAWAKDAIQPSVSTSLSVRNVHTLLAWLLISYLALNFLNVVRPFPIGWDDLGSYLNRPRLIASYGYFIPSMAQFQWEYLTSLGFTLFGYDSTVGATFAMQINWMAGLLAVIVTYAFGRVFFGKGRGVLTAICFYFLPMTGHFSFADMKIDNASYFTSVLAILVLCCVLFKSDPDDEDAVVAVDWKLFVVAGLIMGFSFAIKPTAVLTVFLALSVMAGSFFGPLGFAALASFCFGILAKFGPLNLPDVTAHAGLPDFISNTVFILIAVAIGVLLFAFVAYKRRQTLRPYGVAIGSFILGISIACAPWALHDAFINKSLSVSGMLNAQDTTGAQIFYLQKADVDAYHLPATVPVRVLPPELKLDPNNAACKTSSRTEELDRYWGFTTGLSHYLTLPWRQVMNLDAFGYYVTLMPALLLFPLLLLLPYFWRKEAKWFRLLFAGTCVFLVQWIFVANGVSWYGIAMFLGFALALEALVAWAPDRANKWLFSILLLLSILVCFVNRFWQFDTQKNIFEYPLGKVNTAALREVTIPHYDDIRDSVVSRHETMPDTPYTYRIGTFISYFIPKNREILPIADQQLQFFNCLNQEQNHALTLKRLKALGFNSIIFDTNTDTIETDPNGTLHQKVAAFVSFIDDPALNLDLSVNDPGTGIAYILLP